MNEKQNTLNLIGKEELQRQRLLIHALGSFSPGVMFAHLDDLRSAQALSSLYVQELERHHFLTNHEWPEYITGQPEWNDSTTGSGLTQNLQHRQSKATASAAPHPFSNEPQSEPPRTLPLQGKQPQPQPTSQPPRTLPLQGKQPQWPEPMLPADAALPEIPESDNPSHIVNALPPYPLFTDQKEADAPQKHDEENRQQEWVTFKGIQDLAFQLEERDKAKAPVIAGRRENLERKRRIEEVKKIEQHDSSSEQRLYVPIKTESEGRSRQVIEQEAEISPFTLREEETSVSDLDADDLYDEFTEKIYREFKRIYGR